MKTQNEIEDRAARVRGLYIEQCELSRIYKYQGDNALSEQFKMMAKELLLIINELEWVLA